MVDKVKLEKLENTSVQSQRSQSVRSHNSNKSIGSAHSEVVSRKLAEAEAAKVRLHFAEQEATIRKERASAAFQQATLDNQLELLQQKKETAALIAEANALENLSSVRSDSLPELKTDSPLYRVNKYVENLQEQSPITVLNPEAKPYCPDFTTVMLRKDLVLTRLVTDIQ